MDLPMKAGAVSVSGSLPLCRSTDLDHMAAGSAIAGAMSPCPRAGHIDKAADRRRHSAKGAPDADTDDRTWPAGVPAVVRRPVVVCRLDGRADLHDRRLRPAAARGGAPFAAAVLRRPPRRLA